MERQPVRANTAYLYCCNNTKEAVRSLKRGDETFDQVIQKLAAFYCPDRTQTEAGGA